MSAGSKFQYLWGSGDDQAKEVSAPVYMNLLFDWIDTICSNPEVFPIETDQYPPDFIQQVSIIFKRIFRVYAHVYCKISKALARLLTSRFFRFTFRSD